MRVQIGIESQNGNEASPEGAELYLGLEDVIGGGRFNLVVAEQLAAQVAQRRLEQGRPRSRADDSGRLGVILSAFQPQPDKFGIVAYQTKQNYILRALSFGGVVPEMFPLVVDVPEDLQPTVRGLREIQ